MRLRAGGYLQRPPALGETRLPPGWRPPLRLTLVEDEISDRPAELGDKVSGRGLSVRDEQGVLLQIFEGHPCLGAFSALATPIVGLRHRIQGATLESLECGVGHQLVLVRDPQNRHDPNAVGVWDEPELHQLGWIPSDAAVIVAEALDAGRKLVAWCVWEWHDTAGSLSGLCTLIVPAGVVHEPEV